MLAVVPGRNPPIDHERVDGWSIRVRNQDGVVRDRQLIDSQLRLLAAVRRTVLEDTGATSSMAMVDEPLNERSNTELHEG